VTRDVIVRLSPRPVGRLNLGAAAAAAAVERDEACPQDGGSVRTGRKFNLSVHCPASIWQ